MVAVLGLGGLGHLGLQFAVKPWFRTAVIPRGSRKAAAAQKLGARYHIDSETQDVLKTLQDLGGARLIVTDVSNSNAIAAVLGGLGRRGTLAIARMSPDAVQVTASVNHARTIHRRVRARNRRRL